MDWIHMTQYHSFKAVFLGDSNVGKTCLARLFVECQVEEHSVSTIGFDYLVKELKLKNGILVKVCVVCACHVSLSKSSYNIY